MIDIKDEMLLDFSVNYPRVLITEKLVLLDNIDHLVDFTDKLLITVTGKNNYAVVNGQRLFISSFQNSRIVCSGEIKSVEFYNNKNEI